MPTALAVVGMILLGAGIAYAWLMREGGSKPNEVDTQPKPSEPQGDVPRVIPGEQVT